MPQLLRISVFTLLAALPAGPAFGQETSPAEPEQFKPAQLYTDACVSCHLPPDPELETDRAWIRQLLDTA